MKQRVGLVNRSSLTEPRPHLVSRVADGAYPRVLRQQVSEDPAHLRTSETDRAETIITT